MLSTGPLEHKSPSGQFSELPNDRVTRVHSLANTSENLRRRIEKFLHLPELEENDFKNESKSWIQIENGKFNWGDENTILKNINLEVESNKLIAIVGSVGSGKSSLIQVLV